MATLSLFKKAVKREAKGRVALIGPAGSGKSYTSLKLARLLAGPSGRIAAVDTEHGSLSKYADLFDFDVLELDSFTADNWQAAHRAASDAGYAVFLTDSLSHFWVGKDGALEFVDEATKVAATRTRGKEDTFGQGWKAWRPHERAMIDTMLASPMHIICTMRVKTEYQESTGQDGKKRRVKVGLAPVQRDGLEYEFDLVGYMDEDNTFIVDKSRLMLPDGSAPFTGKAFLKPGDKEFSPFVEWLKGAPTELPVLKPVIVPPVQPKAPLPTPIPPPRTTARPSPASAEVEVSEAVQAIWKRMTNRPGIIAECEALKGQLIAAQGCEAGEATYARILGRFGVENPAQFPKFTPAYMCAKALWEEVQATRRLAGGPQPIVAAMDDVVPQLEEVC